MSKIKFLYEFVGPTGPVSFGYNTKTIGYNLTKHLEYKQVWESSSFMYQTANEGVSQHLYGHIHDGFYDEFIKDSEYGWVTLDSAIKNNEFDDSDTLFLIQIPSSYMSVLFEYYTLSHVVYDELFSRRMMDVIKKYENVKIIFTDIREGSYPHTTNFIEKISSWLDSHKIFHYKKVLITTNNVKITELNQHSFGDSGKGRIWSFPTLHYIESAGKTLKLLDNFSIDTSNITHQDGYKYSMNNAVNYNPKSKKYLNYNRNTGRLHRISLVSGLYKRDLLDYGYVSFLDTNEFFYELVNLQHHPFFQDQDGLNYDDSVDIFKFYKDKYPLVVDSADGDVVAQYDNYMSRKDEYQDSWFSIVSETNSESDYIFITEKTCKPMMNYHPFILNGNPHTLKYLKDELGFKTFSKWWDESYDDELQFRKRRDKILDVVAELCKWDDNKWKTTYQEMEEILKYNRNRLKVIYESNRLNSELLNVFTETKNKKLNLI